jgi:hypothetical protein
MMFIDLDVPGVMFSHSPDYTHHTSEDTPDKVDPVELERCEIIATAAMLYLSNLEPEEAVQLASLSAAKGAGRIGDGFQRGQSLISDADKKSAGKAWAEALNVLDHAEGIEKGVLKSIFTFNNNETVKSVVYDSPPNR